MKCIHETIIKDIVDVAKDFKDSDEIQAVRNRKNGASFKSITSKSEALTMVFPVICSKNMSYETAAMISKAIERKAVAMLHMLFTAAQITDAKDGADYISRFHTNLNPGKMTVDDFMEALDGFVEENALIESSNQREAYEAIKEDMKAMNVYFEKDVENVSLNDYKIVTIGEQQHLFNEYVEPVNEAIKVKNKVRNQFEGPNATRFNYADAIRNIDIPDVNDPQFWHAHIDPKTSQQTVDAYGHPVYDFDQHAWDAANNAVKNQMDNARARQEYDKYLNDIQDQIDKNNIEYMKINQNNKEYMLNRDKFAHQLDVDDMNMRKTAADISKLSADIAKNRLVDQDVKKANELVPTLMHVNFVSVDDKSKYPISTSLVVGVKAKLYAIDGVDIMDRLKVKHNDKNLLLNLVKASTREISFFKDFILAIDKAKIDAISQSRRGSSSKMWKVLERRATKSKIRRFLSMKNDATAITTVCITQDEAEFLKKTEYIDIENSKTIRPIMDAYNMMGFVIADESLEVCKFMFDTGDDQWEMLTFNNLEKEQKDNTKKIINLMSKMR